MAHASFIYVDQNNNVFDYTTGNTTTFDFNIETLFCLYGNPLVNYVKLETYSQEDFDAIITIEKIRRYDYDIFNTLVGELNKHSDKIISEDLKTLSSLKSIGTFTSIVARALDISPCSAKLVTFSRNLPLSSEA